MLRPRGIRGDERQIDFGLGRGRELDLGLLGGLLEPLQRELVAAQVDALFLLEFVGEIIDEAHVEVFAAQERIAVRGLHLEHAVADLQNRNIEGAAAEVIDRDRAGLLLVEAVSERPRGRFVDDAQHFEAGDLAGILGGLALGVVEVGGDRDDGLLDLLSEIAFRRLLHLLQNEGGDLRGRIGFAFDLDPGVAIAGARNLVRDELLVLVDHRVVVAATDQPLDREDGAFRIGDGLTLGRLADEPLAVIGEGDDRRRRAHALGVFDDFRGLAFHHGDARIGGAEIDADDLAHGSSSLLCSRPAGPRWHPNEGLRRYREGPRPTPQYTLNAAPMRRLRSYRRGNRGRKAEVLQGAPKMRASRALGGARFG